MGDDGHDGAWAFFSKKIWFNQVDMLWNQAKLGSGLSQNNLILED